MKNIFYYNTELGRILIAEENSQITNLIFEDGKLSFDEYQENETEILKKASIQLKQYLNGKRKEFSLQLNPDGTDFMQQVWNSIKQIPYGTTCTYKDIAEQIDNHKAYRAVGNANNKNPIPIIIPCHRVISSKGNLAGFSGGIEIKKVLLQLEENILNEQE